MGMYHTYITMLLNSNHINLAPSTKMLEIFVVPLHSIVLMDAKMPKEGLIQTFESPDVDSGERLIQIPIQIVNSKTIDMV